MSRPTSSSQPAAGLSEAEISARSTKHAAWLASGAAILAAIVALGGTWLSGRTSSDASDRAARTAADAAVKAVSVQLFGETEKSRAEFLREQRRILYVTIIADENRLHKAEQNGFKDMYDDQQHKRQRTKRANSKLTAAVDGKFERLEQDQTSAEVIASPIARSKSAGLVDIHSKLTNHVTFWSHGGKISSANLRNLAEMESERNAAFNAFCEAVRTDMGSE